MKKAIMMLVLVGVGTMACGGKTKATGDSQAPIQASLAKVELLDVANRIELQGTVEAARQTVVSSRVMATVTAVHVKAGDTVKAGQVMVEIDPQTSSGQEAQARGALAQAQAAFSLASRNYERFKALAGKGAASELELDMARTQFEQAKGAVEQGQGAVEAAASVAGEAKVRAPFAGKVAAKMVEVGDLAAPGRPLVTVETTTGQRLALAVPESVFVLAGLRIGMELPVRIDALGGDQQRVVIEEISSGADSMNHTFTVKGRLSRNDVPSGLTGRAWVSVGSRKVLVVPTGAIVHSGGLPMVAIRDAEGRARTRAVVTGEALSPDRIEVLSGLTGGEVVLVGLLFMPNDGALVEEVRQ